MFRYRIEDHGHLTGFPTVTTYTTARDDEHAAYLDLVKAAGYVQLRTHYDGPGIPETLTLEKCGAVIGFASLEWKEDRAGRQADA